VALTLSAHKIIKAAKEDLKKSNVFSAVIVWPIMVLDFICTPSKDTAADADIGDMGKLIQFPNCKSISPEVNQRILDRTEKAAYWVRRWADIHSNLCEAGPKEADAELLDDASFYMDSWLQDRNREAIKARGF
jgi:hypothetical protein